MSTPVYSALRTLLDLHNLGPAGARRDLDGVIIVDVANPAALETFAAAVEKPVERLTGALVVEHEVDGVPARFVAYLAQPAPLRPCRLQMVESKRLDHRTHFFWRFLASNGEQLARSSETYDERRDCVHAAVIVFGLTSTEALQPGAQFAHGLERVVVEEAVA